MNEWIKLCQTCEHYPNDKHCIGCEWDNNTGGNTKWELKKNPVTIERKVIDEIKADITSERNRWDHTTSAYHAFDTALEIIDKHI